MAAAFSAKFPGEDSQGGFVAVDDEGEVVVPVGCLGFSIGIEGCSSVFSRMRWLRCKNWT